MQVFFESKSKLTYDDDMKKYDENIAKQFKRYKAKTLIIRRK